MAELTRAAFARLIGVDRSHVHRLEAAGRLVLSADGKRVLVDESRSRIEQTSDPGRDDVRQRWADYRSGAATEKATAAPPDTDTGQAQGVGRNYAAARAVKERYLALSAKLEYERALGKTVDADDVRKAAADAGAMLRALLENWPDQMAPVLAPVTDIDEVRRLLDDAVETVLGQLADALIMEGKA